MKSVRGKAPKIFENEDYSQGVPLWRALAEFTSEDLDDGLKLNTAIINKVRAPAVRSYNFASAVNFIFGVLSVFSLIGILIAGQSSWRILFTFLSAVMLLISVAPQLLRHVQQYGWNAPDAPLELPHAPDRHFDEFLGILQKETGPRAYTVSRFRNRRVPLKRQQFFGKLRYLLFSEHSLERATVMRFRSGFSLPADIFLRRDQVDEMIATRRTKRQGGPGRNFKFRYIDAVISLFGDPRFATLDLSNSTESVSAVTDWLQIWLKAHPHESGDNPRRDQISKYAKEIVAQLQKTRPPENR